MLLSTMIAYFVSVQIQPDSLCDVMLAQDGFSIDKVKEAIENGQTDWKRASEVLHEAPSLRLSSLSSSIPLNLVQNGFEPVKNMARRMTVGTPHKSMDNLSKVVPAPEDNVASISVTPIENAPPASPFQSMQDKIMKRGTHKHFSLASSGRG